MAVDILKHRRTFFFVLCPSDSFCVKFDVNCFNNICEKRGDINGLKTCYADCYTVPANVLFSDVKRQISLVLKVTAKMYLICFQTERQSRR